MRFFRGFWNSTGEKNPKSPYHAPLPHPPPAWSIHYLPLFSNIACLVCIVPQFVCEYVIRKGSKKLLTIKNSKSFFLHTRIKIHKSESEIINYVEVGLDNARTKSHTKTDFWSKLFCPMVRADNLLKLNSSMMSWIDREVRTSDELIVEQ